MVFYTSLSPEHKQGLLIQAHTWYDARAFVRKYVGDYEVSLGGELRDEIDVEITEDRMWRARVKGKRRGRDSKPMWSQWEAL